MQFQIPQFIETEDKVVGPFSLKQFMYVGGGLGISAMLYFMLGSTLFWFPFAIFFTGGGLALAFVKLNGRPLPITVMSAIAYFWKPRVYVWQPDAPNLPKNEDTVREATGGFSLDNIISGLALKTTWQKVQTGSIDSVGKAGRSMARLKERYQIFDKITGDREVAKRVDYR